MQRNSAEENTNIEIIVNSLLDWLIVLFCCCSKSPLWRAAPCDNYHVPSKRHILADSRTHRMSQWANVVERFAQITFRRFLPNRRVSLTTKWSTRLSAIERSGIASVTSATYPASPNTIPNLVCHVRKSVRYI
jgi:hypothetical protein